MLFDTDIAGEIASAFEGQLKAATLNRTVVSSYDPETDTETTSQETYTTEGIVENYSKKLIAEGVVQSNERKILLLADPLGTTPSPGDNDNDPDKITIESETFTVVDVEKDPANAIYTVRGRL